MVGDGGKKEVAILPTGETMITPAVPTLAHFPAKTQVIPSIDEYIARYAFNSPLLYASLNSQQPMKDVSKDIQDQTKALQYELQETRRQNRIIARNSNARNTENRGYYLSKNIYE